jgi:FkbM family methyltransferase
VRGGVGSLARRGFQALERAARGRPALQRLARSIGAASRTRSPLRFTLRELLRRRTTAEYVLHDGLVTVIRHPLLDMFVLEEVFRERVYEFPPGLAARLRSAAEPPLVADLGGHVGLFGLFALEQLPDARIVSFEPDPRNSEVLRRCISANGRQGQWELVQAGAASEAGAAEFSSAYQLSGLSSQHDAITSGLRPLIRATFPFLADSEMMRAERVQVPLVDVLPVLADADLIKMDVEGSEWSILADKRFSSLDASAIVLEYHAAACPEDDAEGYLRRLLERAGFVVDRLEPDAHGAGIVWGVRP